MKELMNCKLKKNLDYEINCQKGFISAIYPIILILGALIGTIVYPIMCIIWTYKYANSLRLSAKEGEQ